MRKDAITSLYAVARIYSIFRKAGVAPADLALDTTAKLLRRFSTHTLRLRSRGEMPADLVRGAAQSGGWWSLPFGDFDEVEPLLARIRAAGCRIDDLEIGKPDLEEVFIRVMQGQAEASVN